MQWKKNSWPSLTLILELGLIQEDKTSTKLLLFCIELDQAHVIDHYYQQSITCLVPTDGSGWWTNNPSQTNASGLQYTRTGPGEPAKVHRTWNSAGSSPGTKSWSWSDSSSSHHWRHHRTRTNTAANTDLWPLGSRHRRPLGNGHRGVGFGGPLLLGDGCGGVRLVLGLHDADVVWKRLLGANLPTGIPGEHDLHLDAEHTCRRSRRVGQHWIQNQYPEHLDITMSRHSSDPVWCNSVVLAVLAVLGEHTVAERYTASMVLSVVLVVRAVLTLAQQYVADSCVHVVVDGVSTVDHQTVHKLHGLCPLTPELAGHNHLTTLGTALHDEPQHSVARPAREPTANQCPDYSDQPSASGITAVLLGDTRYRDARRPPIIALTLLRQMPQCLHWIRTHWLRELDQTHRTWNWASWSGTRAGSAPTRHRIITEGTQTPSSSSKSCWPLKYWRSLCSTAKPRDVVLLLNSFTVSSKWTERITTVTWRNHTTRTSSSCYQSRWF